MARNPYLNKPNGGALKPSATMGQARNVQMARKKPYACFLDRLSDDTVEEVLADAPSDVDASADDLTRAYLVEIRICEKTWADSHESYPFVYLYYATPDVEHIHRVRTTAGVDYDGDGGYELTPAADSEFRSSILTAADGQPHPDAFHGLSPAEVRKQYRRVLRDEHGLDVDGDQA